VEYQKEEKACTGGVESPLLCSKPAFVMDDDESDDVVKMRRAGGMSFAKGYFRDCCNVSTILRRFDIENGKDRKIIEILVMTMAVTVVKRCRQGWWQRIRATGIVMISVADTAWVPNQ
jgi:hypothetical protein